MTVREELRHAIESLHRAAEEEALAYETWQAFENGPMRGTGMETWYVKKQVLDSAFRYVQKMHEQLDD